MAAEHRLVAGVGSTQSGWARYRSLSGLTISGSTQMPNSMPSPRTCSISGASPRDARSTPTSRRGPTVSSRRPPNQPSSSTNRSTPTAAARSASRLSVEIVVEVHRLPRVEQHWSRPIAGAPATSARRRGTAGSPEPSPLVEWTARHRRRRVRSPGRARPRRGGAARRVGAAPAVGQRSACSARCRSTPGGAPDLAVLLAEPSGAGPHERRMLVGGAARRFSARNGPSSSGRRRGWTRGTSARGTSAARWRGPAGQRDREVVEPVLVGAAVDQLTGADGAAGVALTMVTRRSAATSSVDSTEPSSSPTARRRTRRPRTPVSRGGR